MTVSTVKTAELIEMPFGMWTRVGPRKHVLDGVQIPIEKGNFDGKGRPIIKYRDTLRSSVQKTSEPIDMPLGLWA